MMLDHDTTDPVRTHGSPALDVSMQVAILVDKEQDASGCCLSLEPGAVGHTAAQVTHGLEAVADLVA
jgi:hypothetical protein